MASEPQQLKRRDDLLSTLDVLIQALSIFGDTCSIPPAQVAISSAGALLTMIRDSVANKQDYLDLGVCCGEVCQALGRGLEGRRLDELSKSVLGAIEHLTTTVARIQNNVIKRGQRSVVSRMFHSKNDKDAILAWKQDLNRILRIFNTELLIDTHLMVANIHRNVLTVQAGSDSQNLPAQVSVPAGEYPPPPPRACFGRDELIEDIVSLAVNLDPIALIGGGGIGKTSIALAVLHHNRIKDRFGENRRFIRCDQFPASRTHFLARLSEVIGAGVENPDSMAPLRPYLSSQETIIILDNAESILDPQGTDAQEISVMVDELSRFKNVCLVITSRISTAPRGFKRLNIPTLSMDAARSTFHRILRKTGRRDLIDEILQRLDFHPLSVTLLATLAFQNDWDDDRLAREWKQQRAGVLQAGRNESLAVTIELSLASPTFRALGPSARELLGLIAFFPQGLNTKSLDWLPPTISNPINIIDKLCALSFTYRRNEFISMLAPLRDYLCPMDPFSFPLLRAAKDHYFARMSEKLEDSRWIGSEDVNVEHLLYVFTSFGPNSDDVWSACVNFLEHLSWHKPRQTILGPRIEALPDNHPSKRKCLFHLARSFGSVGNHIEQKRLFIHALKLERECGDDQRIALTLRNLSDANRTLGLYEEGIHQIKESLEIYERIGEMTNQGESLILLAQLLCEDKQLDAAEEAAFRAVELLPEKGEEYRVCSSHRVLGDIYRSKGNTTEAIDHFETALEIASPLKWGKELFWIHFALARLFLDNKKFQDAHTHIEQARSHAVDDKIHLGLAILLQAGIWYQESRLEDAKFGALQALGVFEKLGALEYVEGCRALLQNIEKAEKS